MNIRTSAFRGLAILSLSILGLTACDDKEEIVTPPAPITVQVVPASLDLQVGQSGDLAAIVNNSTNQTVTWSTSNAAVATVSATGRVTAVAPGAAVITATSAADATKRGAAGVTVTAVPTPVITLTVQPSSAALNIGGTVQLVPSVTGTTNTAVTYTSSATGVATVSATGLVTAVAPGVAVITTRSAANTNVAATTQITVNAASPISVSVNPSTASAQVGGTVQFVQIVTGTTNQNVTWTSSSPSVATITAGGLATAVSAGTAVITATSAADPNARATAVLTVTALPPVTLSVTPTTITNLGAGASTQIVATVTGSTNQNVTCSTADAAVATVAVSATGRGCNVTGVAAGSTVITVASAADPTVTQSVLVTVVGASVAIANIPAQPTAPGAFVINANVSVPAGTADFLDIILTGSTGTQYRVRCQTFTAAGAATTVTCPINPADYDPNTAGAQVLPNGVYSVRAELLKGANVAATATFGQQLTLNNANTVAGVITFDNTTNDADNDSDASQDIDGGGNTWFGGSATITLSPSIFQGNALNTIDVVVDLNCNAADDGAGEPSRTVTIGAGGSGSVTFAETATMAAATPGIDDLVDPTVCFALVNPRDSNGAAVTLAGAGAGTGNVITAGTVLDATLGAATQNTFAIDNVPPVFPAAAMTFDPADFDLLVAANVFLGTNSVAGSTAGATATVLNGVAGDDADADLTLNEAAIDGVDRITTTFYAVPAASFDATSQTTLAASAAAGTAFTSATALAETLTDGAYVLVAESKDALGNVFYRGSAVTPGGSFGVDLTAPTLAVVDGSSPVNAAINPADVTIRYEVTDANSGAEGVRGTTRGHSVFEYDADAVVEVRCYNFAGAFLATETTAAPCVTQSTTAPVVTIGAVEYYEVTIPAGENYYEIVVVATDEAGNTSTNTITRSALVDVTAGPDAATLLPMVSVNSYSVDNVANTATVNGVIRDNVEIDFYDARFVFPALTPLGGADADVPDAVPFTTSIDLGSFGLPLTNNQTVTATTTSNVDAIASGPAGATVAPNQFGFGVTDLASNYGFGGIPFTPGAFTAFAGTFTTFVLNETPAGIDRTPGAGASSTTTLSAVASVGPGDANPLDRVYFYYVDPGSDLVYGTADDHNVLIGSVQAASAAVLTGETVRTYTFSTVLSANSLPANVAGFGFRVFAIGVASDGDGVITEMDVIPVAN